MRYYWYIIEPSLEVKLPTLWTDGKAYVGRVREEKGRRKKMRERERERERAYEKKRGCTFFKKKTITTTVLVCLRQYRV